MTVKQLDKTIKYIWAATSGILTLFLGAILTGIAFSFIGSAASLLLVVFLTTGIYYGLRRYANWGYEVKDDHLYIQHGVLKKTYSMVPYVRVQHIDTDRGPLERVLGLSTLRVYTAGSKGADIKIPGLEKQQAATLQKKLRDSAISSEKGFDAV